MSDDETALWFSCRGSHPGFVGDYRILQNGVQRIGHWDGFAWYEHGESAVGTTEVHPERWDHIPGMRIGPPLPAGVPAAPTRGAEETR